MHITCFFPVWAQTERPPSPEFSFSQLRLVPVNSAGRPAGVGGAYLALGDDAPAAAINPAGLSYVYQRQISLSQATGFKARDFPVSTEVERDGKQRVTNGIFDQTLVNFVYPTKHFTFAAFRQVVFRSEFDFTREQYLTIAPPRSLTLDEQLGASGNFPGLSSGYLNEVVHNSIVVAKAISSRLRVGVTVRTTHVRLQLEERHYFEPNLWLVEDFTNGPNLVGPNRAAGLHRIYSVNKSQMGMSGNLGVVVELTSAVKLGLVYDYLPSFKFDNNLTLPAYSLPARGGNNPTGPINFTAEERRFPFELDLPDQLGAGVAWKVSNHLSLAADAVLYRNDNLVSGLNFNLPQNDAPSSAESNGTADVQARDHVVVRTGFEYRIISPGRVWPLRFGFYTEPNLALQAASKDQHIQAEYPDVDAYGHVTAGVGVVFDENKIRVEGSLDYAPANRELEAIGSIVVRF